MLIKKKVYGRRECIEIVGLPEKLSQEELEEKVVDVFKHAGVEVTRRDFHAIHPLKKKSVVIAKCLNRRDAMAILHAKKSLRETSDEEKDKLGVTGKIFINVSLCPEYRRLFGIANALYKKKKLASLYTVNGMIRICKKDGDEKKIIEHIDDLKAFFGEQTVEDIIKRHKESKL